MTATKAYEFNICAETEDVLAFFRARGAGGTAGVTSTAAQTRVRCPFATIAPSAGRGRRLSATDAGYGSGQQSV